MENNKKYKIIRYFDDHYDGLIDDNLNHQEARNLLENLEKRNSVNYSYQIKEME